jgi:hypothetical protein
MMASPSLHASRLTGTLLTMLLASVLWWPVALADAQPATKVWRIGLFHVGLDHVPPSFETLRAGLKALGYEEGRNIHLDWRNLADEEAGDVHHGANHDLAFPGHRTVLDDVQAEDTALRRVHDGCREEWIRRCPRSRS